MSFKNPNENTSDVAQNIKERLQSPDITKFCDKLNKQLEVCHVQVGLKGNFKLPGRYVASYLVFVLLKNGEIVSHISCTEYLRESTFLVGINSFTLEAHRRHHYNLLLRGVALGVIAMLYEGIPMKIYSSIANYASLQALDKYFKIETYNFVGDRKVDSVLLDGKANKKQVASVIQNFLAKCAEPALKGGSIGPAWAHPVGTLQTDQYNRKWVVQRLSPHGSGKTWVLHKP